MKLEAVVRLLRQRRMRWSALVLVLSTALLGVTARGLTINPQTQPWGSKQILIGVVSDSICGGLHVRNGHGDAECTRLCVKQGAEYALVGGNAMLILNGHQADLDNFAGRTVIVMGIVRNNAVTVESVAPLYIPYAPIYTKLGPR